MAYELQAIIKGAKEGIHNENPEAGTETDETERLLTGWLSWLAQLALPHSPRPPGKGLHLLQFSDFSHIDNLWRKCLIDRKVWCRQFLNSHLFPGVSTSCQVDKN